MTEEKLIRLTQAFDAGSIYLSPTHFNFKTLDSIERHDKHNETRIRVRIDPAESVAGEPVRGYRSYFVRESPEEVLQLLAVVCGVEVTAVAVAANEDVELSTRIFSRVDQYVYEPDKGEEEAEQKPVFAAEEPHARARPAFADFVQTIDGEKRPLRLDLVNDKVVRVFQARDRLKTTVIVLENDAALFVDGNFAEVCAKIYGPEATPAGEATQSEFTQDQRRTLQTRIRQQRKQLRALNQSIREMNSLFAQRNEHWEATRKQLDDAQNQLQDTQKQLADSQNRLDVARNLITRLLENRKQLMDLCSDAGRVLRAHGVSGGLVEALDAAIKAEEPKDG